MTPKIKEKYLPTYLPNRIRVNEIVSQILYTNRAFMVTMFFFLLFYLHNYLFKIVVYFLFVFIRAKFQVQIFLYRYVLTYEARAPLEPVKYDLNAASTEEKSVTFQLTN